MSKMLLILTGAVLSWQMVAAQTFNKRTREAGFSAVSATNGVAVADFDQDGDLDVYFVTKAKYDPDNSQTWNRLYRNVGGGRFFHVRGSPELAGRDSSTAGSPMGHKMGASWGDYDNDGWPDLYLTHFGPNQLLHNNGDGTFSDVTDAAGVGGGTQLSTSALWLDYDADGDLDLYVSNWEDHGAAPGARDVRNWLFENQGGGVFVDASESAGLDDNGLTWTTVSLDMNSDGLLDLYLANDFGPNRAYVNRGDKTFEEVTTAYGLEDSHHGMGLAIADCDHNGHFDIYLTNITESGNDLEINPLFMNSGAQSFSQQSVDAGVSLAGWGWGSEFFDIESDGDEDLFVATGYFEPDYKNVLFVNGMESGVLGFENVAGAAGVADADAARGIAIFDYDRDGDLDVLVSNFSESPHLYQNTTAQGHWLTVGLEGTLSNRDGYGTIVEISAAGAVQKRLYHGAQYLGQNQIPVHVGLGAAVEVDRIIVRWPSGHVDEVGAVFADQHIEIKETVGLVKGVQVAAEFEAPDAIAMQRPVGHPNPFAESTTIRFELETPGWVTLTVIDALGRRVYVSREHFPTSGRNQIRWQVDSGTPADLPAGMYFYELSTDAPGARPQTGSLLRINE